MSRAPDLARDPIPRLIAHIAIPASAGMFFQMLFNTADSYWAGQHSAAALTALGASFPVFLLAIATAMGFGQGATALISAALGEEDRALARAYVIHGILAGAILGALLALFALTGARPALGILGLSGGTLDLAFGYLAPIFLFGVAIAWGAVANAVLNAQGDAKSYRNALAIGAVVNVGLDPLLMWGAFGVPGLGLAGIAWSTVLIQCAQTAWLARKARASELGAECGAADFRFSFDRLREVFRQGTPASATMAFTGFGLFVFTYFFGRHGEAAVAAYGVSLRIEQMALLLGFGLNAAALTLIARNFGAGRPDRVREIARTIVAAGLAIMLAGGVFVWALKEPLLGVFTDDPEVIEVGLRYLTVAVTIFPAYSLLFTAISTMQGLKQPSFGMIVGFCRHVLGPLAILPILDPWLGWGLDGVIAAIFVVAWSGAIAAQLYMWRALSKLATSGSEVSASPVR